jgi:uncharacterized protein YndB with AHSA1/START domain
MKELHSEIEIDASAELVWGVLTDFASYPEWNSSSARSAGSPRSGSFWRFALSPLVAGA